MEICRASESEMEGEVVCNSEYIGIHVVEPQHNETNELQHSGICESQNSEINVFQDNGTCEPQHSETNEPQHSDINEPHHIGMNEPRHSGVCEPQHSEMNKSSHSGICEPETLHNKKIEIQCTRINKAEQNSMEKSPEHKEVCEHDDRSVMVFLLKTTGSSTDYFFYNFSTFHVVYSHHELVMTPVQYFSVPIMN